MTTEEKNQNNETQKDTSVISLNPEYLELAKKINEIKTDSENDSKGKHKTNFSKVCAKRNKVKKAQRAARKKQRKNK